MKNSTILKLKAVLLLCAPYFLFAQTDVAIATFAPTCHDSNDGRAIVEYINGAAPFSFTQRI